MPWKGLGGFCDKGGDVCKEDDDCDDNKKCCFNGCQSDCVSKDRTEKYGTVQTYLTYD